MKLQYTETVVIRRTEQLEAKIIDSNEKSTLVDFESAHPLGFKDAEPSETRVLRGRMWLSNQDLEFGDGGDVVHLKKDVELAHILGSTEGTLKDRVKVDPA